MIMGVGEGVQGEPAAAGVPPRAAGEWGGVLASPEPVAGCGGTDGRGLAKLCSVLLFGGGGESTPRPAPAPPRCGA